MKHLKMLGGLLDELAVWRNSGNFLCCSFLPLSRLVPTTHHPFIQESIINKQIHWQAASQKNHNLVSWKLANILPAWARLEIEAFFSSQKFVNNPPSHQVLGKYERRGNSKQGWGEGALIFIFISLLPRAQPPNQGASSVTYWIWSSHLLFQINTGTNEGPQVGGNQGLFQHSLCNLLNME